MSCVATGQLVELAPPGEKAAVSMDALAVSGRRA
jgi:hypothetical protein